MAYVLTTPARPGEGLRAVLMEEMAAAAGDLQRDPPDGQSVHSARKHFKKGRAVLRLLRPRLGKAAARENARLRDFGRSLAGARDAAAMVEALDRESPGLEHPGDADTIARVRGELAAAAEGDATEAATMDQAADRILAGLAEAGSRVVQWTFPEPGFGLIAPGLETNYRQGRQALADCAEEATVEHFHEWRKRVKDHWYHMRLLAPAWPAGLDARVAALKGLSDLLGNDHDLAVLRHRLATDPALVAAGGPLLDAPLARRQAELRADALEAGRRIYAEKPKAFRKRMGRYWAAWSLGSSI